MKSKVALLALALACFSCKKDTLDPSDAVTPDIGPVPVSFGQNVLIEQFTQASNGQCPLADSTLKYVKAGNPDRICAVNLHVSDPLCPQELQDALSGGNVLNDFYNISGVIPAGMMNRNVTSPSDLSPANYVSRINSMLSQVPRCGVALDANLINGGYVTLEVHVGFSADLPGAYRLNVYLVKDGFIPEDSSLAQSNDFPQAGPDPLYFYEFPYVVERVITNPLEGEVIPESSALKGKSIVRNYILDLRGKDIADYTVVAFVDKYAPTYSGHRVENARSVKLGQVASWN